MEFQLLSKLYSLVFGCQLEYLRRLWSVLDDNRIRDLFVLADGVCLQLMGG